MADQVELWSDKFLVKLQKLFSSLEQISHLDSLLPLLLQVPVYAVLCCFIVKFVLCTLKFLWSLALVYFAYGTYS